MATETFHQWLVKQEKRDDPTGDLARDAKADKRPSPKNTPSAWMAHLRNANACSEALEALDAAWREYQS